MSQKEETPGGPLILRAAEIEDGKERQKGASETGAFARLRLKEKFLVYLVLCLGLFSFGMASAQAPKPNVILILVDDLGYGDVGAYGATDIQTPNIDRLATEGVAFSNFHVAPSCSLSRVMFLTGSYAPRTGMSRNFTPSSAVGIHANEVTIAELAKSAGYATGVFGKWHLGDHYQFRPLRHGFDEFFGIPHSNNMWPFHPRTAQTSDEDPRLTAARERAEFTGYSGQGSSFPRGQGYPNLPLYDNDTIIEFNSDQTTFTSGFTDRAIDFIERHASEPFFVYLPHSAPHVPLHPAAEFVGTSARDLYGDTVEELDFHVGRILDKLTELGIDNNTLVIFASDNGPWLEYGIDGGSAMPYTAGKETQFEGGVRVPGLMRWPGQLGSGQVISEPVSAIDVLPTLAGLFGATVPSDRTIDGIDIWPLLNGDVTSLSRPAIFGFDEAPFSQTVLGAVRAGNWKLMVNTSGSTVTPVALYDLGADPIESIDVKSSNAGVVDSLRTLGQQIVDDINANRRPLGQVVLSGDPFTQEAGFAEIISIEAEHFHTRQARSGHNWDVVNVSHNSAGEALRALPDSGANINNDYVGTSPHLEYRINVRTPGRYYVWVRARATDDSADSLHVGLNGVAAPNGFRISNFATYWSWSSTLMITGERAYIDIPTAGEHVLDIWMREDGTIIDKIVLTPNDQFEPEGQGLVESQQGSLGPALEFDIAAIDLSADEGDTSPQQQTISLSASDNSSAAFTISSSDPSWLTAAPASGTTPTNSITITADPTSLSAGVYNGTITATATDYDSDVVNVTLTVVGESTGFQQDPATGLVSIETENFDTNTPQGVHTWASFANGGASGGAAMEATPNTGTNNNTGYQTNSPQLDYLVNFTQTGTYYVWVRGRGPTNSDDSLHVGLNGIGPTTADRVSGFGTTWGWSSDTMDVPRATIEVTTPGEHVVNVWMREDGTQIDKIMLTPDAALSPTSFGATGPAESPRGPPQPGLDFSTTSESFTVDEGETAAQTANVSLVASDATGASYSLSSSDPAWLTAAPSSGTTPTNPITITADPTGLPAGVYNGTITATATGYISDAISVTLTVVGESTGFQQDPSTGLVSIDIENFDTNTPQGGHAWSLLSNSGASGGSAMEATPNTGTNNNTGFQSNSPRLDYLVNFTQTGTHYIWVRGRGATSSDDSLHVGLNNSSQSTSDRITGFGSAWTWSDDTMDVARATIEVTSLGEQPLNIWMREDGTQLDKIVLTTDPNLVPSGFGPPQSSQGPPQPELQFDTASESFTVDEGETTAQTATVSLATSDVSGASYSLSSSDPSWLTVSPTSGTTPAGSITITADPTGLAAGVYNGTITATATGYISDAISVTLTVVGESAGFQQDPSTGLLSIEVENFDSNTPQGSHTWSLLSSSGASGGTAMEATPNTGTNNNTGYQSNSPRLDYLVNFTQTGTHYIWVRGQGLTSSDDSLHVGLNGSGQSTSDRITGFGGAWGWSSDTMDVTRATINVGAPGEQTLNIWMREDGTRVDKIVLTTDSNLVPSGFGPPQSSQGPPQPELQFDTASESFTVDEGETTAQTATVSLDTSDASAASFSISSSDPSWLTATPTSGTTPANSITVTADPTGLPAGIYSGTITATATGYVTDAVNVTLDVQGALAFSENFDSSDDSNWTPFEATGDSANWQIIGGEYRQTLAASATTTRSDAYLEGTYSVLNAQPSLTDFEFAVEVTPQASGLARLGDDVGIMFRYVDDNNYYRLSINSKFGQTRLERRVGGTFSTIAVTSQGYLPGQVVRIGVRMQGAAMLLYRDYGGAGSVLDGDAYVAGYDSSLASGAVALYTQSEAAFDNVELRSLGVQPRVGLVSPAPFLVDPDDTINAQAVVVNASGGVDVDFELDGNPCSASTQPQQQLFVTNCVAPSAGEHVVEAIMRDPGEVDRDTATAVATEGLKAVTFGDSITSGFGDGFFLDNIGNDIDVGGVPVGPRSVAVRGFQTGVHDQLTADAAYTSSNVVFDEGIPGERAIELIGRLPTIIERHPDLNAAWVMIGTNDANQNSPQASGLGCSGAACNNTFKGTLLDLVDDMLGAGVSPVLAKIPPIFGQGSTPYADPFSSSTRNATALEYNNAIGEVITERGLLAGPDFYDDFLGGGENRYTLFRDFLHPNSLGYVWMSNAWKQVVAPDGTSVFVLDGICVRRSSSACVNPAPYKQNLRTVGDTYYLDRTYTLTSIPAILDGGVWLLTENDDKTNSRSDYLEFSVDRDVDVYVAFTTTATSLPNWLQGFEDTSESLGVTAGSPTLKLYREFYASGSLVTLGGNVAAGIAGGGNNNYVVIVVPR